MHYLLFIPNVKPSELESACRIAGLSAIVDQGYDVLPIQDSAAGVSGLNIGWLSPSNPFVHYDRSKQTWLPSITKDEHGKPRYWVGIWKDSPPTQSELRRPYTQRGPLVQFGSEKWILPTPDTVDARAVYADDGSMKWETVRQFAWMCDEAKQLQQTYLEELGVRRMVFNVDPRAQIDWLLKLLQVNYRLTPEVAVHLDMWVGRDHLLDVFLSTLGLVRKQEADTDGR